MAPKKINPVATGRPRNMPEIDERRKTVILSDPWPERAVVRLCEDGLTKSGLHGYVTDYFGVTAQIVWQEIWEGDSLKHPGYSIEIADGVRHSTKSWEVKSPVDNFPLSRLKRTGFHTMSVRAFTKKYGDSLEGFEEYVAYCGRFNDKYTITKTPSPLANPYSIQDCKVELRAAGKNASEESALRLAINKYKTLLGCVIRVHGKGESPAEQLRQSRIDHEAAWYKLMDMAKARKEGRTIVTLCWCDGPCHTYIIHRTVEYLEKKIQ